MMKAKEYAIYLLGSRDYSEKDILKKLEKRYNKEESQEVLEYLLNLRYIDDEKYAKSFINSKYKAGYGPRYIQQKLYLKGIRKSLEEIEGNLLDGDKILFDKSIITTGDKYLRKQRITDQKKLRERLFRHLVSKGFSYEEIKSYINRAIE